MKKLKRVWHIMKVVALDKLLIGFFFFVLFLSLLIQFVEPNITTYGDALWYCFNVITTIGFGDYYAVTLSSIEK